MRLCLNVSFTDLMLQSDRSRKTVAQRFNKNFVVLSEQEHGLKLEHLTNHRPALLQRNSQKLPEGEKKQGNVWRRQEK